LEAAGARPAAGGGGGARRRRLAAWSALGARKLLRI